MDCTTRITDISSNECVGDSLDTYTNNFEFLEATLCNLEFSAVNVWNPGYSSTTVLSAGWDSTMTTIRADSTEVGVNSAAWDSVFTTVAAFSGTWAGEISIIYPCPIVNLDEACRNTIHSYINTAFPATDYSIGTTLRVFVTDQSQTPDYAESLSEYTVNCAASFTKCFEPADDSYIRGVARFKFLNTERGIDDQGWLYQSFSSA